MDMLTRLWKGHRKIPMARCIQSSAYNWGVNHSPLGDKFEWPYVADVKQVQGKAVKLVLQIALQDVSGVYWLSDEVWVPPDAADLKLRLLIVAHTGMAGHRGEASTRNALP